MISANISSNVAFNIFQKISQSDYPIAPQHALSLGFICIAFKSDANMHFSGSLIAVCAVCLKLFCPKNKPIIII